MLSSDVEKRAVAIFVRATLDVLNGFGVSNVRPGVIQELESSVKSSGYCGLVALSGDVNAEIAVDIDKRIIRKMAESLMMTVVKDDNIEILAGTAGELMNNITGKAVSVMSTQGISVTPEIKPVYSEKHSNIFGDNIKISMLIFNTDIGFVILYFSSNIVNK